MEDIIRRLSELEKFLCSINYQDVEITKDVATEIISLHQVLDELKETAWKYEDLMK